MRRMKGGKHRALPLHGTTKHRRRMPIGIKPHRARSRAALIVLERDGWRCRACGTWLGRAGTVYRRLEQAASGPALDSPDDLPNQVLLCKACGRLCAEHDPRMLAAGYWLRRGGDPAREPIVVQAEDGHRLSIWLTADGRYSTAPPP
jgi:hypothetical protein